MVCSACGASMNTDARFCVRCGAGVVPPVPVYAPPVPLPTVSRLEQHLQPLGILWLLYGVWPLVEGMIALPVVTTVFGTLGRFHPEFPFGHFAAGWIWMVTSILALMAVSSLLVAFSLLTRQPWGRVLAIVFAVLALIKIPFGTALGIYTLWVLLPAESEWEYRRIATDSL